MTDAKPEPLDAEDEAKMRKTAAAWITRTDLDRIFATLDALRARLLAVEAQLEAATIRADLDVRVLELQSRADAAERERDEARRDLADVTQERNELEELLAKYPGTPGEVQDARDAAERRAEAYREAMVRLVAVDERARIACANPFNLTQEAAEQIQAESIAAFDAARAALATRDERGGE